MTPQDSPPQLQIEGFCPHCGFHWTGEWQTQLSPLCPGCEKPLCPDATADFLRNARLDQCPFCGSAHLYRQKDFNRRIGVATLVVGVGLSYWTYGLSLLFVTVLDVWIYRRVGDVACCYLCESQFRGSIQEIGDFDLELHDYYRNLKRRSPASTPS